MSLSLLQEVRNELRRLSIAGGALAANDFRLKKLIPQLAEAGKSAPVFARLGSLLEKAMTAGASALLEAGVLVNAILYTQGTSGCAGELDASKETPCLSMPPRSFREIAPLLGVLTSKGGGRYEIIQAAIASGAIVDLRLLSALLQALDDSYLEIPPLIAGVLKKIGPACVPGLQHNFEPKGKSTANVCRLDILAHYLREKGIDLYRNAYETGSPAVKVKAIEIMADYQEFQPLLIEISTAKRMKEEVREAAISSLARQSGPMVGDTLRTLLAGGESTVVYRSIANTNNPSFFGEEETLALASSLLESIKTEPVTAFSNAPQCGSTTTRFLACLIGLAYVPEKNAAMYDLSLRALDIMLSAPQAFCHNGDFLPEWEPFSPPNLSSFRKDSYYSYYILAKRSRLGVAAEVFSLFGPQALGELQQRLDVPGIDEYYVFATLRLASVLMEPQPFFDLCQSLMGEKAPSSLVSRLFGFGQRPAQESRKEHRQGVDFWLFQLQSESSDAESQILKDRMDPRWLPLLKKKKTVAIRDRVQKDGEWVDAFTPRDLDPLIHRLS